MQPIDIQLSFAALLFNLAPGGGSTHYVDDALDCPGQPCYATIQAAVDAASPGDTILIQAGEYAGFTIQGKHLTILANEATVIVHGTVSLWGLPASPSLSTVLGDLEILGEEGLTPATYSGVHLSGNDGNVLIQDCVIRGGLEPRVTPLCPLGRAGLLIEDCGIPGTYGTTLVDCFVGGGAQADSECAEGAAGEGIALGGFTTQLALYDTFVDGGSGTSNLLADGSAAGEGGAGLRSQGVWSLLAFNSPLTGGDGGNNMASYGPYGFGGPGVLEEAASATFQLDGASVVTGGLAGCQAWGRCGGARWAWIPPPSQPLTSDSGSRGRRLGVRSLVDGRRDALEVRFRGESGDRVELWVSDSIELPDAAPGTRGLRQVRMPVRASAGEREGIELGAIGVERAPLVHALPADQLRVNGRAVVRFLQARVTDVSGRTVWTAPRAVVLLPKSAAREQR